ncbi:hypothetical protein D7V94_19270 [Parablautia intestinalis]|uniref:Uncharacterized protein n=2 Tax=Parablautia intestinalis TaxID=2320100 RepID=A0A3A9AAT9_9FIRM|nr:hypothetical protein D7V94_19270 [Parablautia intestinalis]
MRKNITKKEHDTIMPNIADEILKTIKYAIDRKAVNCDITYESVIKDITPKGYVILDRTGSERTVQCCIPGVSLRMMQRVWVKEPMGNLKDLHICGVVGNTNNSKSRRR